MNARDCETLQLGRRAQNMCGVLCLFFCSGRGEGLPASSGLLPSATNARLHTRTPHSCSQRATQSSPQPAVARVGACCFFCRDKQPPYLRRWSACAHPCAAVSCLRSGLRSSDDKESPPRSGVPSVFSVRAQVLELPIDISCLLWQPRLRMVALQYLPRQLPAARRLEAGRLPRPWLAGCLQR